MMKRLLILCALLLSAVCAEAQTSRTISLNGRWQVALSEQEPTVYPATAPVPGVMTQATPRFDVDFDATKLGDDVGYNYVWYATEFDLSNARDGYDNLHYSHAWLRLRAKYNARVFLNGIEIGYDAHCAYSHAEFDLTQALNFGGKNRLVVRVGSWNTASYPSKDNSAEWWRTSRAPGICDDVSLILTHDVAIRHLKILPDVANHRVDCTATVVNYGEHARTMKSQLLILDCRHDLENDFSDMPEVCSQNCGRVAIPVGESEVNFEIATPMLRKWTQGREGDPQLYQMNLILSDDESADCYSEIFGYRDIRLDGNRVLINGKPTLFRAENIAFQRALNRWANQVFDEAWIRRFLRAVVQEYGFNYLRIHLGHAYSKWYDIADEEGVMIQDEWRFMHDDEPVGDDLLQTELEFMRWVKQNVNHPSIVAWDQENEGHVRLGSLTAELRQYDPTRLWSEEDFSQLHVYEYSETISDTPEHAMSLSKPVTVLESCRLWLNEWGDLEPQEAFKTSRTASGWGLYFYTLPEIQQLQTDIHADLGSYYRAQRVQAWAPFALLSGAVNGHNYFSGDLGESLTPQENLLALSQFNEPIGCSVEMLQAREWYKECKVYSPKKDFTKRVCVWNDTEQPCVVTVQLSLTDFEGRNYGCKGCEVEIPAGDVRTVNLKLIAPRKEGIYRLSPSVITSEGERIKGVERRVMVAREAQTHLGEQAFGGHPHFFPNSHSVLENFTGRAIDAEVQNRLIAALQGELVDKVELLVGGEIRIQTTLYLSSKHTFTKIRTFDAQGDLMQEEQSEALTFAALSESLRTIIAATIGMVPVDESKIRKKDAEGMQTYTITVVGSKTKHILCFDDERLVEYKRKD